MPFYQYQPSSDAHCEYCEGGFERLQKLSAAILTECPRCRAPCTRVVSAPHVRRGDSHVLDPRNLESRGFTQYRKTSKGEYEKTAGKGPRHLSDKD